MHALMVAIAVLAAQVQDDRDVAAAARATADRGFTIVIKPSAAVPGFAKGAEALAGPTVHGQYVDGLFHATDGSIEIYRKGGQVVVKTVDGWRPLEAVLAPLRGEIEAAFGRDGERFPERGNLTRAREARRQLIRLLHIAHRSDVDALLGLSGAFEDGRVRATKIEGAPAKVHEAGLTTDGTFELLQGPFEQIVQRGELSFSAVAGAGRAEVQAGMLRRMQLKARAKYVYHDENEDKTRRGTCTLELAAEITNVGRTRLDVPVAVTRLLGPIAQ